MKSLWANIFRNQTQSEETITSILKKIPVFEDLSGKELDAIARILHQRQYRKDELIFRQGDAGVGMYIIQKGQVHIRLEPDGQILAELTDGEFFGELALLDDSPRSASAVAGTDCKMLGFFQPDLFGLIERNPRLGVKIVLRLAKIIGERLKAANRENQDLKRQLNGVKTAKGNSRK